jgi:hypothetical protein
MQLFAEQLGEVLGALGDTRVPKRRSEKRSFFRIGARYRVSIRQGTFAVEAWLRDVSATGVGIHVAHASPPPLGATVTLDLPRKDGSTVSVACVVRNASQISRGTHQLGVSFVLPIDEVRASLVAPRTLAKSA